MTDSCFIVFLSHFPPSLPSLWAEDSVWNIHQPSAGQNPRRDGWPWEDRGQRDGWPDHGGWPVRPRVPPPQDTVLPVHQSGSRRAEREGRCPGTEELKGGRRTRDHKTTSLQAKLTQSSNIFFFFMFCVLGSSVPPDRHFLPRIYQPWW